MAERAEYYYVYAVIKQGKIVYVGKGCGGRFYVSYLKHNGDDLLFLETHMSEGDALAYERLYIWKLQPADNSYHKTHWLFRRVSCPRRTATASTKGQQ